MPTDTPHLEIVSHCWQYAHLAIYQFSSLVNYPPTKLRVTHSLYYAEEDTETAALAADFAARQVANVTWRAIAMPKAELYRRAIGRHRAALATTADWIWFADCDLIFGKNCLDSLSEHLTTQRCGLMFPNSEGITELLPADHPWITTSLTQPRPIDVDHKQFYPNEASCRCINNLTHGGEKRMKTRCFVTFSATKDCQCRLIICFVFGT